MQIPHEGHQGITKPKAFIHSKIWLLGHNDKVDHAIKECAACQSVIHTKRIEPLKMSEMPSKPWTNLSADFCGPLLSDDYFFVITDEYSRYPVLEIIKSESATTVIPVLDMVIITTSGIPNVIKTDNGAPFNSYAFHFRQYAENIGFNTGQFHSQVQATHLFNYNVLFGREPATKHPQVNKPNLINK